MKSQVFVKQACSEVLAMAMHLCETHNVANKELVHEVINNVFTSTSNMGIWFQFLNPFGNMNSTVVTDSLYPFKPTWRNFNGLQEKSWTTKRHLKALDYYLTMANKHLLLVGLTSLNTYTNFSSSNTLFVQN